MHAQVTTDGSFKLVASSLKPSKSLNDAFGEASSNGSNGSNGPICSKGTSKGAMLKEAFGVRQASTEQASTAQASTAQACKARPAGANGQARFGGSSLAEPAQAADWAAGASAGASAGRGAAAGDRPEIGPALAAAPAPAEGEGEGGAEAAPPAPVRRKSVTISETSSEAGGEAGGETGGLAGDRSETRSNTRSETRSNTRSDTLRSRHYADVSTLLRRGSQANLSVQLGGLKLEKRREASVFDDDGEPPEGRCHSK